MSTTFEVFLPDQNVANGRLLGYFIVESLRPKVSNKNGGLAFLVLLKSKVHPGWVDDEGC